ncbi:hypothetical protein DFH29DRAFT_1004750 [Suillus ampliporus]|nr:hypothetical protein DFH29DRAFT_1004750 [Suillus ampliporus]
MRMSIFDTHVAGPACNVGSKLCDEGIRRSASNNVKSMLRSYLPRNDVCNHHLKTPVCCLHDHTCSWTNCCWDLARPADQIGIYLDEYIIAILADQIGIYLDEYTTAILADQIGIYLDEYIIAILADQIGIYLDEYPATALRFTLSNGILLRWTVYTTMSTSFQPTYVILCNMHLEAVSCVPEDLTPIYAVTTIPLSDMRRRTCHALFVCTIHRVCCTQTPGFFISSTFEFVSTLTQFLPTVPRMTNLYCAEDFDADGNFISGGAFMDLLAGGEGVLPYPSGDEFYPISSSGPVPSINEINWNDPSLYTMPLTSDEIAAITEDIRRHQHKCPSRSHTVTSAL